jgi:hypothetical protein
VTVDLGVKRDETPPIAVVSAAALGERAAFAAVMGMAEAARAAIDEARTADPAQPHSYVAEGLLVDGFGDRNQARAAFEKAIANGTDNAYAFYRAAAIALSDHPEPTALAPISKQLSEAVQRNTRFADAYAALGEVRAAMNPDSDTPASLVLRAIALEPADPEHHLSAARVFWRRQHWERALTEARAAQRLARTDNERAEAQRIASGIEAARPH